MIYLTNNEQEAWDQIEKLDRCHNCRNYNQIDLFNGVCNNPELGYEFNVSSDSSCECFAAREKRVQYWIDKLVQMALEAGGVNDFNKQLEYHQTNGTDLKFLGLEK